MANALSTTAASTTAAAGAGTRREQISSCRLLDVIKEGSSGTVHSAEDLHSRRQVVVKVLRRSDRFLEEAPLLTRVQHEHLVSVLDAGEENGQRFLVMEALKGETLHARLKREHRLPLKEAMRIGREMAAGLAFAHAHGLIHRDICPSNVWLEPSGRVRLLGLGSAAADTDDPLLTRLSGSANPGFLSPEQAAGEPVTTASDLFSLGCTLYQMATGERPFRGDNPQSLIRAVVFEHPKAPREINPDIPEPLDELMLRLLAKLPADRLTSQNVEIRLVEWLDPTAPKPVPLPDRLPEPAVYPASRRILESINAARVADALALEPPTAAPKADDIPSPRPRWVSDLIAAAILLVSALGLYFWWRASN